MKEKKIKEPTEYEMFIVFLDFIKQTAQTWNEQNKFDQVKILEYCQKEFINRYKDPIEKILQSKGI